MKKTMPALALGALLSIVALTGCKPEVFANCTAMHAKYQGGVGIPGAVDVRRGGGHARYAPKWDKALYDANAGSDRDGDHIACEQ